MVLTMRRGCSSGHLGSNGVELDRHCTVGGWRMTGNEVDLHNTRAHVPTNRRPIISDSRVA